MSPRLLVLLPGYDVARHLSELVERIHAQLPSAEVLLVDDGSTDDTAAVAEDLGLTVLRHPANRGKGEALKSGFAHALREGFAAVVTMDADLQHLPEELPRFLARWREGHAVVVGNRMAANTNMPWLRKRTNEFTSAVVSRLASTAIPDSQNGYRLIASEVLASIELESSRYDLESELLIKAGRLGYSIAAVPISTVYRDEESSIHPFVDTLRFFRLVWRARRWRRQPGHRPRAR